VDVVAATGVTAVATPAEVLPATGVAAVGVFLVAEADVIRVSAEGPAAALLEVAEEIPRDWE